MLRGLAPLVALAACGRGAADQAYLDAALGQGDCEAVEEPALRGECVSFAAHALALAGDREGALRRCAGAEALWRDECVFLVSDTVDATFAEADRLCNQAASLRPQCLGHASNREARALLEEPGGEQAALRTLTERVRAFRGAEMARDEARRLVVQKVAARGADEPFDPALCGSLEPALCRDVYIERILRAPGVDPKLACEDPTLRAELAPWAAAGAQTATEAWDTLCTRGAGGAGR